MRKMKRKHPPETSHDDDDDDTDEGETCGVWIFRVQVLQKFASYRAFAILFGIVTCLFQASHMYFSGIISTVEKRFGFSSKVTGRYFVIDRIRMDETLY